MAKKKKDEPKSELDVTLDTLCQWVDAFEDAGTEANGISEKCREYYDSKQLTAGEVSALRKRKQAPIVINRIKPKIDALLGMEKSAKTTVKALPRTPKHEKAADAATEGIRFVLEDNHFDQVRSACWEYLLIEGTCGAEIIVSPPKREEDGFKIGIKPIFWDRLIYDFHDRSKAFSNPRYLGQVVWMDEDDAIAKYPGKENILNCTESGNSNQFEDRPRWMDTVRKRVKIVELYYRKDGDWWHCVFTRGGHLEEPAVSPFINEEGETEHAYEFASSFVDREGQRYGAVKQLLDIQDEINARRSKALHLMSVRQVRLERGAVEDVNKVRQELAKPDGVIETTPGMEFEVLKTNDMFAAQFNLLTESKMEIDAVGVNAALTGKDTRAISGVALQERKLAGQTELGPLFDVLRYWQLRVFRKVWNRIRQYWKEEKWVRVTDDEQNLKWVGLNRKMTKGEVLLEQAKEKGLPPEQLAMIQQQIAQDPTMQEMDTHNDIAELDVDLIIEEIPDTLTSQTETFTVLGEIFKSGVQGPALEAVIDASPLPSVQKQKILKKLGGQTQIPPQVQEQMKKQGEELQALQQENVQLKSGQQADMAKLEVHKQTSEAKLGVDKEQAMAEHNLEAWKAEQAAALAKAKAESDANIARAKADSDAALAQYKLDQQKELDLMTHEHEKTMANEKLDFEKQCKLNESAVAADSDAMPRIMESLQNAFAGMAEGISQMVELQKQTLAAMERPRQVSIGAVSRDSSGQISGATVKPTLQ